MDSRELTGDATLGERFTEIIESWKAFVVAVMFLSALAVIQLWPTSWWLQVNTFTIPDAKAGQPIEVIVDRRINRPFFANWTINVRKWDGGGWVITCIGKGATRYRLDAVLPTPVTMDWWTGSACPTLPVGKYIVDAIWVIDGNGILPDKRLELESNVFEVTL